MLTRSPPLPTAGDNSGPAPESAHPNASPPRALSAPRDSSAPPAPRPVEQSSPPPSVLFANPTLILEKGLGISPPPLLPSPTSPSPARSLTVPLSYDHLLPLKEKDLSGLTYAERLAYQYGITISDLGAARWLNKDYPPAVIQTREYRSPEVSVRGVFA